MSRIIKEAYESREKADYLDFYVASRNEAEKQIERAEQFLEVIRIYLDDRNIL
jgi:uncharacterized protein (UPF0332 family)